MMLNRKLCCAKRDLHHAERKEICALMTKFYAAEANVVKFLDENKTWCGIPEQAITVAKTNHEHTLKFRTAGL